MEKVLTWETRQCQNNFCNTLKRESFSNIDKTSYSKQGEKIEQMIFFLLSQSCLSKLFKGSAQQDSQPLVFYHQIVPFRAKSCTYFYFLKNLKILNTMSEHCPPLWDNNQKTFFKISNNNITTYIHDYFFSQF